MAYCRELTETRELLCLRRLAKDAPDMKLVAAQTLAAEHGETFAKMMDYSASLTILAETLLGFSPDGAIPPSDNRRPAVAWALQKVQECHAGYVCGPCPDNPMEVLMQEKDAEWLHKGTSA